MDKRVLLLVALALVVYPLLHNTESSSLRSIAGRASSLKSGEVSSVGKPASNFQSSVASEDGAVTDLLKQSNSSQRVLLPIDQFPIIDPDGLLVNEAGCVIMDENGQRIKMTEDQELDEKGCLSSGQCIASVVPILGSFKLLDHNTFLATDNPRKILTADKLIIRDGAV